jgi:guanine nucleotide-binding protein G(I)/G(S)/G(T) subunit beta-1
VVQVSSSQDGNLLVWDAITQQKTRLIPLKSSWVMTCAYSPTGRHVASGGLDNIATIYNVDDQIRNPGEHAQILGGHTGYISCCRFLPPDDGKMVTSSGDGTCRLWDVTTGKSLREFHGHKGDVMTVSIGGSHHVLIHSP